MSDDGRELLRQDPAFKWVEWRDANGDPVALTGPGKRVAMRAHDGTCARVETEGVDDCNCGAEWVEWDEDDDELRDDVHLRVLDSAPTSEDLSGEFDAICAAHVAEVLQVAAALQLDAPEAPEEGLVGPLSWPDSEKAALVRCPDEFLQARLAENRALRRRTRRHAENMAAALSIDRGSLRRLDAAGGEAVLRERLDPEDLDGVLESTRLLRANVEWLEDHRARVEFVQQVLGSCGRDLLAALDARRPAVVTPHVVVDTLCHVCRKRERRLVVDDVSYCKRCAHTAGVLEHGKIT